MCHENESGTSAHVSADVSSPWEADHWSRLQELFHLAGSSAPQERTSILQTACSDSLLIDRVLELLAASEDEPLLPVPVADAVPLGTRIGPYALLRHLGTGGLGSVYLTERMIGGALQKCAVKVLSMHAAGPQFESRFLREQQILATLDHAHITRLLDAGFSETNQPYLVMEYVDGVDLVRYCDEHTLGVAGRLELFLQVCEAVAYAHRSLTVHLDLKPSNVLVSMEGQVKLLDFGTSKLIEPDSALTTTVLATPAYAAPEQLRNEPVTTACDIYSLGAVLFETLAGQRPFQNASAAMVVERAFAEQEPATVTTAVSPQSAAARGVSQARLKQLLTGDLSTIVARCLHSRPRDRYMSVDALAEDIRRHLTGLPVLARPQTRRYRLAKFFRRNRKAVFATTVASVAVATSLSYAALRQHEALRDAERAVQMQNFMTQLFRLAHSGATGKPAATVGEMLQVGIQVLPTFIPNPADQRAAQLSIAESMYDDDDFKDALPILLTLADKGRRDGDTPVEAKAEVLAGDIDYTTGHTAEGDALTTRALSLSSDPRITQPNRTQIIARYVANHDDAGDRSEKSMQLLRAAIRNSERAHAPEQDTASAINILGLGLQARGHLDEAEHAFQHSLAIYQRTPYAGCDLADTERYLGYIRDKRGDSAGALVLLQQSYDLQRKCAGPDDLATLSNQAWVAAELVYLGRPAEAITMLEPAMPSWRKVVGPNSPHLSTPLNVLSRAYLAVGRCADSKAASRENLTALRMFPRRSSQTAAAESHFAEALACERHDAEALPYAAAAVNDYPPTALVTARGEEVLAHMKQVLTGLEARTTTASNRHGAE